MILVDGENVVNQDIDFILENWEYKPGIAQARLVQAHDGRQVIQLRIDLGALQLETTGRPDGAKPHGHATFFEYLQEQARLSRKAERNFALSDEQCQDADREFLQFYHRRMCWLALRQYTRAIRDADHTLAFMDFVKRHAPNEEYLHAHEQYRGFVLFQRTQAAAALQVENNAPEEAINELRLGLERIREFFAAFEREEEMEEDGMVRHLRHVESTLREQYKIDATLEEQLQQAIADEDYERAARSARCTQEKAISRLSPRRKRGWCNPSLALRALMRKRTVRFAMEPQPTVKPAGSKPPAKNNTLRYAITLVLVVAVVGGIAWVIQYLPSRGQKPPPADPSAAKKKMLAFERGGIAEWGTVIEDADGKKFYPMKDVEPGDVGYYDFLFKNVSGGDLEIVSYYSSCDCTNVKACVLSASEWAKLEAAQRKNPAENLPYSQPPKFVELSKDPERKGMPLVKSNLEVKADEGGVVRIEWNANKSGGLELKLRPMVLFKTPGSSEVKEQALHVPVKIWDPIQIDEPRLKMGAVMAGRTASNSFIVWSATRKSLDFKLASPTPDPLFEIKSVQLLGTDLERTAADLKKREKAPNVLCAYQVTVTVYESKDGRFLEQGSFYRKWPFTLEGKLDPANPTWGPEVVGRVEGDIAVGGADHQGKITFPAFSVKQSGAIEKIQLRTKAGIELEKIPDGHPQKVHQPLWIKVELSKLKAGKTHTTWELEVEVPHNAPRCIAPSTSRTRWCCASSAPAVSCAFRSKGTSGIKTSPERKATGSRRPVACAPGWSL